LAFRAKHGSVISRRARGRIREKFMGKADVHGETDAHGPVKVAAS
jgi:hypothetical protein